MAVFHIFLNSRARIHKGKQSVSKRAKKRKDKEAPIKAPEEKVLTIDLFEDVVICFLFCALALLFATNIYVQFSLPKLIALRIGALILVFIWIYRLKKDELKSVPGSISYTVLVLASWWGFSTFFAVHIPTALYGSDGRYNGLWTHELYLLLFTLFSTIPADFNRLKRIVRLFVLSLIPVAVYALIQYMNIDPIPWPPYSLERTASTVGNPVTLGALIGLSLPFALTFFFEQHKLNTKICWGFVFFILLSASVSTFSRGPWIGTTVALAIVILLGACSKLFPVKRVLILSLCILAVSSALFAYKHRNTENVLDRVNITALKTEGGLQTRLLYYRSALRAIKDHPVMGVGFENFRNIYPRYRQAEDGPDSIDETPTAVHNGYIQATLTNGIPALLLYFALLACIYTLLIKTFIKSHDVKLKYIIGGFLAAITGYLIQDLSGWLEIAVTPFFWIVLGLSVSLVNTENHRMSLSGWKKTAGYVSAFICLIVLIVLILDAINTLHAERLFFASQKMDIEKDWNTVESNIKEALENVPGDHHYHDMAGLLYMKKLAGSGNPETYQKTAMMFENAHYHNPFDPYALIHRIDTDTIGIRKGVIRKPSEFTEKAIDKLCKMDKNNPTVYEALAKLLATQNRFNDSFEYLNKAKVLRPREAKYYTLEGLIHRMSANPTGAINAYKEVALKLENRGPLTQEWIDAKQGAAFSYIDQRDFNNALKEIQSVLDHFPNHAASYVVMGNIYASMNNFVQAKESFLEALKIEPTNPYAQQGLEKIKSILGIKGPVF